MDFSLYPLGEQAFHNAEKSLFIECDLALRYRPGQAAGPVRNFTRAHKQTPKRDIFAVGNERYLHASGHTVAVQKKRGELYRSVFKAQDDARNIKSPSRDQQIGKGHGKAVCRDTRISQPAGHFFLKQPHSLAKRSDVGLTLIFEGTGRRLTGLEFF
ncbi:hypothetical protein [Enterobacter soli]|uniref:hypothetical protein n=1 Tax=Enterobacter soli TaxID=885040 RepID=UPI0034CFC19A